METFIEKNCTVSHDGKKFEARGAMVTSSFCIGYLAKDNILTDWHGNKIGTYKVVSTWKINSFLSDTMQAIHARVQGVTYKGRSLGVGMIFKGKRTKDEKIYSSAV